MIDPLLKKNTKLLDKVSDPISYAKELLNVTAEIDDEQISIFTNFLNKMINKNSFLFIGGNGGSNSIANHASCDLAKGGSNLNCPIRAVSLGQNLSLSSAISNDYGFEFMLSKEIELLARENDSVILFSSSGKSLNIINAIKSCERLGISCLLVHGFRKQKQTITKKLHIPSSSYFIIEDISMNLVHQYIAQKQKEYNKC